MTDQSIAQILAKIADIRRELSAEDRRQGANAFQSDFMASKHRFGGKRRKATICQAIVTAITVEP